VFKRHIFMREHLILFTVTSAPALQFYKWLGTGGGTVSKRTANKKLN